jgi:hypothetical protein
MRPILFLVVALVGAGLYLRVAYRRWREATERERFFLAMKEISSPEQMSAENRLRLRLMRSPWWALWRWWPDFWRRPPPPNGSSS